MCYNDKIPDRWLVCMPAGTVRPRFSCVVSLACPSGGGSGDAVGGPGGLGAPDPSSVGDR